MSTALLQEVYQETRRLYIAGSDLATDDFRLNRLLPRLQQLGERAPVFKRIGDGVAALLAGSSAQESVDSATQLQRLTLLVLSVLRTQGSTTSTSEQAEPLSSETITLRTRLTYRQLAPVQQALTTTGGGRFEIVEQAWKEGYFDDLRLLPLAVRALADPYSEIAELAMKSIVPGYGKHILPYLMEGFNPQGGKLEIRKMKAIQAIAGTEYADFYFQTAETAKGDMKAAAIAGLEGLEQYLPYLLEWSKDKKREVRAVAYHALAQLSAPEAQEVLFTNFSDSSRDLELVVGALYECMQPELAERLHAAAWEALNAIVSHSPDDAAIARYTAELQAHFQIWQQHHAEALYEMYRFMLKHPKSFEKMDISDTYTKKTLLRDPSYTLSHHGNNDDVELLYELEQVYPHYIIATATAVHRHRSPQEFYEHFSQGLGSGSRRGGRHATPNSERIFKWMEDQLVKYEDTEVELLYSDGETHAYDLWFHTLLPLEEMKDRWDPRWLDIALAHQQTVLVAALTRPGVQEAQELLKAAIMERGDLHHRDVGLYFRALHRSGLSINELRKLFWDTVESQKGGASNTIDPFIIHLISQFPAEDIERLEQLIPDSDAKTNGKIRYTAASQLRAVIHKMKEMKG
ncbi:HEAT repeat domain-containing protein [Paenibacillus wenxiniae]|uniref:HEAT repeat domain-containing protein n=1 Tax=Paenibacillus wenxiniae TaxID=1636843 RepID=A0ABW4RLE0_9BACL